MAMQHKKMLTEKVSPKLGKKRAASRKAESTANGKKHELTLSESVGTQEK